MAKYLTNTIIKHKNEYIDKLFYIEKGIVLEKTTNKIYNEHSYIFLNYIYQRQYSISDYITKSLVIGSWVDFNNLDISFINIMSSSINKLIKHNEILMLSDPLIKLSRYIYYEYLTKENVSFYIPSIKELSIYLNVNHKDLSHYLTHLINLNIVSKHNKLLTILNIKSLEDKAFLLDYK